MPCRWASPPLLEAVGVEPTFACRASSAERDSSFSSVELSGIEPPSTECHSAILPLKYSPEGGRGESRTPSAAVPHARVRAVLTCRCANPSMAERTGVEPAVRHSVAPPASNRMDLPMCQPLHAAWRRGRESNPQGHSGSSGFRPGAVASRLASPFKSGSGWTRTTVSAFSAQRFAMKASDPGGRKFAIAAAYCARFFWGKPLGSPIVAGRTGIEPV